MGPCPDDKTLSRYLDGELAERRAARLREHLARCDRCAQRYEDLRRIEQAVLATPGEPAAVPDLASRVTGDLARRGAFFAVAAAVAIVVLGLAGMDYVTRQQWARETGPVLADAERVLVRLVYVKNESEPQRLARARDEVRKLDLAKRLGQARSSAEPGWARDLAPLATTFSLMAEEEPLPAGLVHRLSGGELLTRACRLRETLACGG